VNYSEVVFVFPGDLDTPTGGYRYDRRIIDELRRMGWSVQTLALSDRFPAPDRQALNQARQALAELPDDSLVIIDGLAYGVLDAVATEQAGRLRLIALCHHPLALESGLNEAQRQQLAHSERQALQVARAVIVTSAHTREILIAEFGVPASRVVVALPGTEQIPFAPCHGVPPCLLTVASLTPRKGHDVLIDALGSLRALPWQARFVGGAHFDPAWAEKLRAQVDRQQLSDRIQFVGAVDNLRDEYQRADLFVLPSRFEGYGMVFAEALAAGLPVVAARAGAVPQVVPETAGLLVPPDDTLALQTALHNLLTDRELRRQLQAGARQAATCLPSWQVSAQLIARLLNEVKHA
jgi:glycosyltransferase involved in cell wall biosynthesis